MNTIVVEDFREKFEKPKTQEFISAMKRWGLDPPEEKAMFLMEDISDNVKLSSRNIPKVKVLTPRTLNLFDILNADKLVLSLAAVDYLNFRYGANDEGESEEDDDKEQEEGEGVVEDESSGGAE